MLQIYMKQCEGVVWAILELLQFGPISSVHNQNSIQARASYVLKYGPVSFQSNVQSIAL